MDLVRLFQGGYSKSRYDPSQSSSFVANQTLGRKVAAYYAAAVSYAAMGPMDEASMKLLFPRQASSSDTTVDRFMTKAEAMAKRGMNRARIPNSLDELIDVGKVCAVMMSTNHMPQSPASCRSHPFLRSDGLSRVRISPPRSPDQLGVA